MYRCRLVSAVTLAAFLTATTIPAAAGPLSEPGVSSAVVAPQPPSTLRASIHRAAEQAAAQIPGIPPRGTTSVRRQMMGGGGGGGGMMLMTLLVTAASLAGTYFLVKELKKSTDEAASAQ